jgi:hypothetical protein
MGDARLARRDPGVARGCVLALLVLGCGPSVATDDGGGSGHGSSDTGEDDGRTDVASASLDDGTAASATSADDDGGEVDACLSAIPAACPDECGRAQVWQVIDDACGVTSIEACVPGGPKPGVPPTTYWAIAPAGPVFLEYGGSCSAAAQPAGWSECNGDPGEPADCACFCRQGHCRGDEDREALDGCALATPCSTVLVDAEFGVVDHLAEYCVLEALRDRVPGMYEVTVRDGLTIETTRYYVLGDEAERLTMSTDDVEVCPAVSDWSGSLRCSLAPVEYFDACIVAPVDGEECARTPGAWASGCTEQPPSCG